MSGATVTQTVILADDHPVFLEGIKQYFEERPDFRIVGEAQNGTACIEMARMFRPDWALVDLAMPGKNGFEVLRAALDANIPTKFIVMSMYADAAYARMANDAGAFGFIAKEDALSELDQALLSPDGQFFESASVGRPTISPRDPNSVETFDRLTPAERKILLYLGQGQTSREIADALEISPRTVQKHRQNMAEKLGLHGPNRLLEYAVRHVQILND